MRQSTFTIDLLERAINHAKQNEPQLAKRRDVALLFVRIEIKALRKERRYEEAVYAQLLLRGMKQWEYLTHLLEALRRETGAINPAGNPRTSNTGVNSGIASKEGESVKSSASAGLSEDDKTSLANYIAGKF